MFSDKLLCEEQEQCVRLVFVGSPLLDITASCSSETLQRYDLKADDCVKATNLHEALFQQLFNDPKSRLDAGGSAFNSAKVAQWVLERRGSTAFAGCVGKDGYAFKLFDDLQSSGVDPLFVTLPESPTGVCACLLTPDGKRSMCTRHGASALFSKDHLSQDGIPARLKEADSVFVVGYFVAHSPEVVRALADQCLPSQLFSLSLSAEYICKDFEGVLLDVLPKVDVLFGNEAEVKAFATSLGMGESLTSEHAASIMAKLKSSRPEPRIVVITRGPETVIVVRGTDSPRHFPVPPDVSVVDSVGCGDALAGAFLGVYTLTRDIDRATDAGIQAAVQVAQVPGCDLPRGKAIAF